MSLARRAWRALLPCRPSPAPVEAREAYERLAACYPPAPHNALMELEDVAMAELLPSLTGRRALDLGCGSGRFLRRLHEGGAARVTGCDAAAAMLARAREEARGWQPQPLLARADVLALPFREGVFDVIACGLVLGHVADLRAAVVELARLLAPGGVAVWSDLHPAGTLAGWQRDFVSAEGERLVVRQHLHLFGDHVAACRLAGLVLDDVREPRLDAQADAGPAVDRRASGTGPDRAPAERALREHPQRGWPAVLVVRARRPA